MTGGMNDNDVDDLARVSAFDDLTATVAEAIEGMPAAMTETGPLDHHRIARAFSHGIARVAVQAVLASGVVVSARDVKALAEKWDQEPCHTGFKVSNDDQDEAHCLHCSSDELWNLLHDSATDAEPSGMEHVLVPVHCPQCAGTTPEAAPDHEHEWVEYSTFREPHTHFICKGCKAERTESRSDPEIGQGPGGRIPLDDGGQS